MENCTYIIAVYSIGGKELFDITRNDFLAIREARLLNIFGQTVEEKFDLLLENYADFEKELLNMSVQHSVFLGSIENLLDEGKHRMNRRLANLLTTVKLYQDQVKYALNKSYEKNIELISKIEKCSHNEYDNNLGYRVGEALRNHVQHANFPITSISFPYKRVKSTLNDTTASLHQDPIGFSVIPLVGVQHLKDNKKFKRRVINELEKLSDKHGDVQLIPIIRKYIEGIGHQHNFLRELCKDSLESAADRIESLRKLSKEKVEALEGLAAIKRDSRGLFVDHEYLTDRPIKRWRLLKSKNCHIDSISNRFVTSEHIRFNT